MADTGKITYSVSMTPITNIDVVSNQSAAHDVVNSDIGKALGGGADVACSAGHTTEGSYTTGGTLTYLNAPATSGRLALFTANTVYDFVFIKHTGFQFTSGTVLGAVSTQNLVLEQETSSSNFDIICAIPPGGAIVLPNVPAMGSGCTFQVASSGDASIAVEAVAIT
ncbi:hypothetical protein CMI47_21825 [Candidatus Pacearchaeota archaeon]|nr:hypothetical protein [Candidatus Pacearchaeota archaeon]